MSTSANPKSFLPEVTRISAIFYRGWRALNEPNALSYGIKPPRAMLFVAPPGMGKSLRAKMIARDLGYTLLGISFGDIFGADNPDRVVSQLLELAESVGNAILFLDDWDKGLADWKSGGAAIRIAVLKQI